MHTPTELAKGIQRTYTRSARASHGKGTSEAEASACHIGALHAGVRDAADCEVREMSTDSAWQEWQEWQDSVLVEDFAATEKMDLQPSAQLPTVNSADLADPFASVTHRSA